jgi:hypothetical protein
MISGEKIQELCDYFIGSQYDVNYNPYVKERLLSKWIPIDSYHLVNYTHLKKVFCYTHLLNNINEIIIILEKINSEFDIYFGNSDGNFFEHHYTQLKKNVKNLNKIYSQNNTVLEAITLPIGIANSQWPHGNQEAFNFEIPPKTFDIFLNFDIRTNPQKRITCKQILMDKGIPWIENKSYQEYLKTLSKYRFCICVEGNGLDSHRFWECLYLNVIPICLKNEWTKTMVGKVPMILLDTWESLDTNLEYSFKINPDILTVKYYF